MSELFARVRERGKTIYAAVLALILTWSPPARGAERPFAWDRYHARQDACREADHIAQDCARPGGRARLSGCWAGGAADPRPPRWLVPISAAPPNTSVSVHLRDIKRCPWPSVR